MAFADFSFSSGASAWKGRWGRLLRSDSGSGVPLEDPLAHARRRRG